MKVDDEGMYVGHYTRIELMKKLQAEGHDRKLIDIYIFCGLKECTEWHPSVEEIEALQREQVAS